MASSCSDDIAVVGHFSIDTLKLPHRKAPFTILGGSAAYTSLAARTLDASVSVISRVGCNFPQAYLWWLNQEGINISAVMQYANESTTSFELEYNHNYSERKLRLKSKGNPLSLEEVPKVFHAKVIHLAPIVNEINIDIAERLKKCTDTLSLDPQGLIRTFDKEGYVIENGVTDSDIFSLINIYKSSENEIYALTGEKELKAAIRIVHDVGVETVIVTLGARGAVLSIEGTQYTIGVCPSQVLVDPTGAGDVFIAGFLVEYLLQKESLWCAAVGSAIASCVVEGLGPTYFGKKEEIYRRANVLYEKELKQKPHMLM